MDETGVELVPKNERGWVDTGSVDVSFSGDYKDVSKRQFSTINAYRMVHPTEAERMSYAIEFFGDKWKKLSKDEKEAFRNPAQPPVGIIFPLTPWTKKRKGEPDKVKAHKPAKGRQVFLILD